jgi:hypothetical protein
VPWPVTTEVDPSTATQYVVAGAQETGEIGGPSFPFPTNKPPGGVTAVHPGKLPAGVVVVVVAAVVVVVGSEGLKLNLSAGLTAELPLGVVTVMSTVPAPSAGLTAVISPSLSTVKLTASTDPNSTAVAPVKSAPVMVTEVSSSTGPELGLTSVTSGPDPTGSKAPSPFGVPTPLGPS